MISVVLFFLMVCFARPISILMQAPTEAVDLTAAYVRICGGGIFFIVAYNLLAAIFREAPGGQSVSAALCSGSHRIVNVIGDLILVAGFHLDAAEQSHCHRSGHTGAQRCVLQVLLLIRKKLSFCGSQGKISV
ncbi:MAG: MATE family efflux transporter [Blautia sp.]